MADTKQTIIPNYMKFILGGCAGMSATVCVQPLDLVKNRMQMSGVGVSASVYRNSFHALSSIVANEGLFAVYSGLSAGLLRQATYSTCRLGIYTSLFEYFSGPGGQSPNFLTKLGIAMASGIVGSFVGTPSEVCLIRMTSDGRLPIGERRNYTNVFNALVRIFHEEGLTVLWRGALPTMGRAAVVNGAQLASYSQAKQFIIGSGYLSSEIVTHFSASMFALGGSW
ncbi:MItochondrial Solute Carrier [Fasciola gigantica]|uniref:MItochondrial Solute Carrier n=1 Tax=Fasciola gigantica TaxID=46835 RepID=A0A504YUP1_FASGI|nr:MItochondrial Solute Carrier [Fasciola gigantica]